jgi:hypothetical protein
VSHEQNERISADEPFPEILAEMAEQRKRDGKNVCRSDHQSHFVATSLLSLFVFLMLGAITHIAFVKFTTDIENGALALFAILSIKLRYVLWRP